MLAPLAQAERTAIGRNIPQGILRHKILLIGFSILAMGAATMLFRRVRMAAAHTGNDPSYGWRGSCRRSELTSDDGGATYSYVHIAQTECLCGGAMSIATRAS
jgi:hypothetical protein